MSFALRGLIAFTLISILFSANISHTSRSADAKRLEFYHTLVLEAATAYKRDYQKFDRKRTDIAREAGAVLQWPHAIRNLKERMAQDREGATLERRRLSAEAVYQELELATVRDAYLDEFPALAHVFAGYESPFTEPLVLEGLPDEAAFVKMKYDSPIMTPFMSTIPVHCIRPDFWSEASCITAVPNACETVYTTQSRNLKYWRLTEDLELVQEVVANDNTEVERLSRQMSGLTPKSRQSARLSAKAVLGMCGIASMIGMELKAEKIQISYSQWPDWTFEIPDGPLAKNQVEDTCRHFSYNRAHNLISLTMAELTPHSTMRAMDLMSSLDICLKSEVAQAKDARSVESRKPAAQ